jgi:predicted metal-dependent hydrolase
VPITAPVNWAGHPVHIVRSARRRKTVQLQIRQHQIICRAPQHTPDAEVLEILTKKSDWITQQLQRPLTQPKQYLDGEIFCYLGQPYQLYLVHGAKTDVQRLTDRLVVTTAHTTPDQIKATLIHWYQQQAMAELSNRVALYQGQISVSPSKILIKSYKTRWGTCHADGRISFNWRIILAPSTIVDSVVIHELCHLIHLNHSAQFWQLVQQHDPDHQLARRWLKQHGSTLEI